MSNPTNNRVLTVKQAAEDPKYPFTEAAWRSYIFNASPRKSSQGDIPGNGLEEAIIRKGRRVFLLEDKLDEWFKSGGAS